ncbi:MAG: hypothetical protein PHC61_16770 [Chitinivibrionales bacterium]|nr:hypothetical protein [Chitinivibrionales bacterium]
MATVKKVVGKETAKPKTTINFPTRELNAWLKSHPSWTHNDWIALLEDLKQKGYGALVNAKEGQDSVGLFLETNRKFN